MKFVLTGDQVSHEFEVARIDARTAASGQPSRLCYLGNVIHGVGAHLEKTRNPIQIGAELYGHDGKSATAEVIRLMVETLHAAGVKNVHLDLGHVGIYRALAQEAGLSESALFPEGIRIAVRAQPQPRRREDRRPRERRPRHSQQHSSLRLDPVRHLSLEDRERNLAVPDRVIVEGLDVELVTISLLDRRTRAVDHG